MRLLVAITDPNWFNYLSELRPDEVNFWQPSGTAAFRALSPGEPLLFKLHAPNDFIVGGWLLQSPHNTSRQLRLVGVWAEERSRD